MPTFPLDIVNYVDTQISHLSHEEQLKYIEECILALRHYASQVQTIAYSEHPQRDCRYNNR